MTELNFDEDVDLQLPSQISAETEVSVRARGQFDRVEVSESDEDDEPEDGEDLGGSQEDKEDAKEDDEEGGESRKRRRGQEVVNYDEDKLDEDADDDEDDEDEEGGKKKKQKRVAVRRQVVGDEIEMCFIPLGVVPGRARTLVGVSLCVVRVVTEGKILRVLQQLSPMPDDVAAKEEKKKDDFFEDQFKPDAPVPRHYCQRTRAERHVAHLAPADRRNVFQEALESVRDEAMAPKRVYVYCTLTLPTDELMRAFQSPFLNYPVGGKLTNHCFTTTNWQSATDWPTTSLDGSNADANAALVIHANLYRSTNRKIPNACCTASQPLSINALFDVEFTKLIDFGGDRAAIPVLHKATFSKDPKMTEDLDYVSVDHTLTMARFGAVINRTSMFLDERSGIKPEHLRKAGYPKSMCEMCCAVDATARLTLTRKQQQRHMKFVKKSVLSFYPGVRQMTIDNAIDLLRKHYSPPPLRPSFEYTALTTVVLPALVPPSFWNAVNAVGFDVAVSLVRTKTLARFEQILASDSPHLILTTDAFDCYKLHENDKFVRTIAGRQGVEVSVVKQFAFVRSLVAQELLRGDSESRMFSRPDLLIDVQTLCWPRSPKSPIAAIQMNDIGNGSTTFVTTKNFALQEAVVATCLQHSFERVYVARSDDVETLQVSIEIRALDTPVIFVVATVADYQFWLKKVDEQRQRAMFLKLYEENCTAKLLSQLTPLENDQKWNVAIPRADTIPYSKMAAALGALCTNKTGANTPWVTWALSMFSSSESHDYAATKADFSRGFCSGGKLFLGGLAFQIPAGTQRGGSLVDDLYFSGVYDTYLTERYTLFEKIQQDALEFEQSNDQIVVQKRMLQITNHDDDNDYDDKKMPSIPTLSQHSLMFASKLGVRANGYELIKSINEATKDDRLILFSTQVSHGKILQTATDRVSFSRKNALPNTLTNNLLPNFIALLFDSVADDEFFSKDEAKSDEFRRFTYDFSTAPKQIPATTVDRLTHAHREVKSNVRAGFSIPNIIALYQYTPRSVIVFGSREQSISNRIVAQSIAPWYYSPPTRNEAGRPWYNNSEAAELSMMCWLFPALKR